MNTLRRPVVTKQDITKQVQAIYSDIYAGKHHAAGVLAKDLLDLLRKGRIVGEREH